MLTDDLLTKLVEVFSHLSVDAPRMAHNLSRWGRASMTEGLMLSLPERGLARSEAHELLRTLTRDLGPDGSLEPRASASPEETARIPGAELDAVLSPERYVRAAAEKTDQVLARLAGELAR